MTSLFDVLFSSRRFPASETTTPALRPVVESSAAAVVRFPPAPRQQHPLLTKPDPWKDINHHGSDDLVECPPSAVELFMASRVVANLDLAARRDLQRSAQTTARARAVIARVRLEAWSQRMLERVAGGVS